MTKFIRRALPFLIAGPLLAIILFYQAPAFGAVGDVIITVTDELGSSLSGATVTINCDGVATTVLASNGTITVPSATATSVGCSEGETITQLDVEKDGYVTTAATGDLIWNAAAENSNTASLPFAYKVGPISTEGPDFTITNSASTVTAGDSNGQNSCTMSGSFWYCPVVLANSANVPTGTAVLDGYVEEARALIGASSRSANGDAQVSGNIADVKFGHKVTGVDELGNDLTKATVTVGGVACTESSSVYYCLVPLASDGGTSDVVITKNGFVTTLQDSTDRTSNVDVQGSYSSGSLYAYKITLIETEAVFADITTDVTELVLGDTADEEDTCILSSATWYCPVLLANSDSVPSAIVTLDGYVARRRGFEEITVRTANTDAQVSTTLTSIQYAHKVITKTSTGEVLTAATVTIGEDFGAPDCIDTGLIHYCPVGPFYDGRENDVLVTRSGFEDWTTDSLDRDLHSDVHGAYISANAQERSTVVVEVVDETVDEAVEAGSIVIPSDIYFSPEANFIIDLYEAGVVEGRGDSFEPTAHLTRAEALKIILLARGYELIDFGTSFKDVSLTAWYFPYVITAKDVGLVQGYSDLTFRPNDPVTRDEYVKMLLAQDVDPDLAFESDLLDVDPDKWYAPYAEYAHDLGLDDGDLYFIPGGLITRAEAARMAAIMMD